MSRRRKVHKAFTNCSLTRASCPRRLGHTVRDSSGPFRGAAGCDRLPAHGCIFQHAGRGCVRLHAHGCVRLDAGCGRVRLFSHGCVLLHAHAGRGCGHGCLRSRAGVVVGLARQLHCHTYAARHTEVKGVCTRTFCMTRERECNRPSSRAFLVAVLPCFEGTGYGSKFTSVGTLAMCRLDPPAVV